MTCISPNKFSSIIHDKRVIFDAGDTSGVEGGDLRQVKSNQSGSLRFPFSTRFLNSFLFFPLFFRSSNKFTILKIKTGWMDGMECNGMELIYVCARGKSWID